MQAKWDPIDLSSFLSREAGITTSELISDEEKAMSIEEFLLWEAKKQEKVLRNSCMQQIAALEAEFSRAYGGY